MTTKTQLQACIFNIQKFSIHDGPGIRIVVFFKVVLYDGPGVQTLNHKVVNQKKCGIILKKIYDGW